MTTPGDWNTAALAAELEQTRKALRRFNPRGSDGRRILLTGGLGHMGSRVVEIYLEALPAAEICVADFPRKGAEEKWGGQSRVSFYAVDFLEGGSVPSLLDRLAKGGPLTDAICIHGGVGRPEWELPREDYSLNLEEVWRLNCDSVYELLRGLLDRGLLRGSPEDPATATVTGSLSRFPVWASPLVDYGKAKNDLYHAMVYLASRAGSDPPVRFHMVSPGTMRDTFSARPRHRGRFEEKGFPLGSMADGYDVGESILAFTELCRKATGVETRVDGGQYFVPGDFKGLGIEPTRLEAVEKGRQVVERIAAKLSQR